MLILQYTDDGTISNWRYEPHDSYEPDSNELAVDPTEVDHRNLPRKKVDTSVSPPEVIDDPALEPTLEQTFRDARSADDVQAQLDTLFEMVTGESP